MDRPGKFKVVWEPEGLLRTLGVIAKDAEIESAKRIEKRLKKYVPVRQKPYPPSRTSAIGWRQRSRGSLRRTIRTRKSKYKDGGHIVLVGDAKFHYAYWVEKGTVYTFRQKYGRKGEKFMHRAAYLERLTLERKIKKAIK